MGHEPRLTRQFQALRVDDRGVVGAVAGDVRGWREVAWLGGFRGATRTATRCCSRRLETLACTNGIRTETTSDQGRADGPFEIPLRIGIAGARSCSASASAVASSPANYEIKGTISVELRTSPLTARADPRKSLGSGGGRPGSVGTPPPALSVVRPVRNAPGVKFYAGRTDLIDFELIGSRGMPALLVGRSAARLVGTVRVVCLARVGRWTSAKECDGERGVGRRPPPSLRVLGLVGCWFFSHPRCPFHRTQKSRHRILGKLEPT